MSASILLFFSNKCPHCKQFIQECQQSGISSFHKICIDTTPRERIPAAVKSVPALVFAGSNDCLQGDRAFQWLKQEVHKKQQNAQRTQQMNLSASGNSGIAGEPLAWHSTEMGASFSDSYSFIDNSFTESGTGSQPATNNGGSGSTIPKNFAFLQNTPQIDVMQGNQPMGTYQQGQQGQRPGLPSGHGQMPPTTTMGGTPQHAEGQDELSKRMESIRMSRENDIPQQLPRIS